MDTYRRLSLSCDKLDSFISRHLNGEANDRRLLSKEKQLADKVYNEYLETMQSLRDSNKIVDLKRMVSKYLQDKINDIIKQNHHKEYHQKIDIMSFFHELNLNANNNSYSGDVKIDSVISSNAHIAINFVLSLYDYETLLNARETEIFLEDTRKSFLKRRSLEIDPVTIQDITKMLKLSDKTAMKRYIDNYWSKHSDSPFDKMFYGFLSHQYAVIITRSHRED